MNEAVLVTGASDRIGRAIALSFAKMGFNVALHYCNSINKAEKSKKEILSEGVECALFKADFRETEDILSLISRVQSVFNLEFLVNNASLFIESSFIEKNYQEFDSIFNINFKAPYILTKEFANSVDSGSVINILDTKISKNSTQYFDYLLTKKFLNDFTLMSAFSLAPHIRVNAIAPGLILPPKGKDWDYFDKLRKFVPLRKAGSVEDIVASIEFIIDNDFITGQVFYIDGGQNLL